MAKPECIFELPLHGLHVRVLHKEGGAKLTKLSELDLAGAVLVDLLQDLLKLLFRGPVNKIRMNRQYLRSTF